jgi:tetratricopeptide (TPR) repeat protein
MKQERCFARQHVRFAAVFLCVLGLTALQLENSTTMAAETCAPVTHGRDYNSTSADDLRKLRQIDTTHFTAEVQNLQRGATTAYVGSELEFLLDIFPNHHRALETLIRLSFKERTDRPKGTKHTVDCYFQRGIEIAPDDGMVHVLYGVYLSRAGKKDDALKQLLAAEKTRPNDGNVHYNLGLIYFEKKDYEKAADHARKAYSLGFSLPGLREKLAGVGIKITN